MSATHKVSKVTGPPGTGKTTYVLSLIEAAARKYNPERIGAVSYTNTAVEEMKSRVEKSAGVSKEAAKNMRTIHSHCFRLMGYHQDQVVTGAAKIKEWNEENPEFSLPTDLSPSKVEDPDGDGEEKNKDTNYEWDTFDRFKWMNYWRNIMLPVKDWTDDVVVFYRRWMEWMRRNDYVDFTMMMEEALEAEACPDIDILFVDEAQDTSTIQMAILKKWIEHVSSAVFVGDGNQAIMKFSGAVPSNFIYLDATWRKILDHSYRVPKKILDFANAILKTHCRDMEDAPYHPREGDEGEVIEEITEPDFSFEGSHMILCRCNQHLVRWRNWLIQQGRPWHNPYRAEDTFMNPTRSKLWKAARIYARLRDGDYIDFADLHKMVNQIKAEKNIIHGMKTKLKRDFEDGNYNWMETVDFSNIAKLGIFTDEFCTLKKPMASVFNLDGKVGELITCMKDKNDLFLQEPNVILGTIHSVKGGESSNVWIDVRTSYRGHILWKNSIEDTNDEARVAYVAVTRAKNRVGLLYDRGVHGFINGAFYNIKHWRREK